MIYDDLKNIKLYSNLFSKEVLDFIGRLSFDTIESRYQINEFIYANVESYVTKLSDVSQFESHEKYIDIQILLKGQEYVYYTNKSNLTVAKPYNSENDITFYGNSIAEYDRIKLDGTNFVILYPHEAHAPQVCVNDTPLKVKKVVIKIKI